MTPNGERLLREELAKLLETRTELSKAIGEAIKQGDLRENADYHTAKEQQGLTESKIRVIESRLADAEVIDVTKLPVRDRVVFGSTVTIRNLDTDEVATYTIVGEDEADMAHHKIALSAPVARAMIGKDLHAEMTIEGPNGKQVYEIEKIEYI